MKTVKEMHDDLVMLYGSETELNRKINNEIDLLLKKLSQKTMLEFEYRYLAITSLHEKYFIAAEMRAQKQDFAEYLNEAQNARNKHYAQSGADDPRIQEEIKRDD